MTSFTMSTTGASRKSIKSRGQGLVKPILKRNSSAAASPAVQTDLFHTWESQLYYSTHGWGSERRDVSFDLGEDGDESDHRRSSSSCTCGEAPVSTRSHRTPFSHSRSASQASHVSTTSSRHAFHSGVCATVTPIIHEEGCPNSTTTSGKSSPFKPKLRLRTSNTDPSLNGDIQQQYFIPPISATPAGVSPLRTSFEKSFRRRSKSDSEPPLSQREAVLEARRRFEERERAKDEKYERAATAKAEKEAQKLERAHAKAVASGRNSVSDYRASSSVTARSRRGTGGTATSADTLAFASSSYESTVAGVEPVAAEDIHFYKSPRRSNSLKHRTQSSWTTFVLWFRSGIFKLTRR